MRLVEGRDGTVPAVKHLRAMFGYTPAEALAKFKESRTGGSLGTAVEAEAIVEALRQDGYAYEVITTAPRS
ncbi:hypothetical protein [Kitasatospora sp. McL0602]|uniref:hypothetical protein n=1 Tax=Kitasatospora sp. McL0602 TaxID=3439530 RepID=UPI003F8986FE